MIKPLSKIEAQDKSPLDVPGRPMGKLAEEPRPYETYEYRAAPTVTDSEVVTDENSLVNLLRPKPPSINRTEPHPVEAPIIEKAELQAELADEKSVSSVENTEKKPKRLPPRLRRKQEQAALEPTVLEGLAANQKRSQPITEAANEGLQTAPSQSVSAPVMEPTSELGRIDLQPPMMPPLEEQPPAPPAPPPPPNIPTSGGQGEGGYGHRNTPLALQAKGLLANLNDVTDLSICLLPLLDALKWRGDPRHVAESIPHFLDALDITGFRNVMASLHYETRPVEIQLNQIDPRLMPCLYLPDDGNAILLLGLEKGLVNIFDSSRDDYRQITNDAMKGSAYFIRAVDHDDLTSSQQKIGWFRTVTERFRGLVYQTLGITLVLNLLALSTPLFVMAVYDKVVATGSMSTLAFFAMGVGIAVACDLVLRTIRTRILAFIGARLDNIVGIAIFHKILFMPPAFTERATVGAQVARIKDFENIRDFFTGPMALVLFELPFVIIFVTVIAFLGGPVAFIPLIMIALFGIIALIFTPLIRRGVSASGRASSRRQELIVEALGGLRALKYCGAETNWITRYRVLSATAALNGFYSSQYSSVVQTLSHILMVSSGIATVVYGVFRVLGGDMTIGALVASMMLVWRVLGPLQTAFVSITRLTQVKSSIGQVNNLMNIKAEREQHSLVSPLRPMQGAVSFARVSIRFSPDADPALVGVSFEADPGEVVCIVGGNGSGKSTVLKLLASMYQPQAGSIRIDNQDIRQLDAIELRHSVAYVPQGQQFFYGTIAQNLRMAHPVATDEELRWAAYKAGVLEDVEALEQGSGKWKRKGFEVRIGDTGGGQMTTSLLQRLNLARGYLKRAQIMLFDEPGNGLDFEDDKKFMQTIDEMRGETTIFIVTHRPSHLKLADKIVWLEYGALKAAGPAEEVMKQMPKGFL